VLFIIVADKRQYLFEIFRENLFEEEAEKNLDRMRFYQLRIIPGVKKIDFQKRENCDEISHIGCAV